MTNTRSPDPSQVSVDKSVFSALRAKLADEVSGSAMLAELLGKLNQMQECCDRPYEFQQRFDEFVARASDYTDIVRPFFPMLVRFLPLQRGTKTSAVAQGFAIPAEAELEGEAA